MLMIKGWSLERKRRLRMDLPMKVSIKAIRDGATEEFGGLMAHSIKGIGMTVNRKARGYLHILTETFIMGNGWMEFHMVGVSFFKLPSITRRLKRL